MAIKSEPDDDGDPGDEVIREALSIGIYDPGESLTPEGRGEGTIRVRMYLPREAMLAFAKRLRHAAMASEGDPDELTLDAYVTTARGA